MSMETKIKQVGGQHYQGYAYPLDRLFSDISISYWHGVYIKYIFRYRHKNGLEDLYKAASVLQVAKEEFGIKYAEFEKLIDFIFPLINVSGLDRIYLDDKIIVSAQRATGAFNIKNRTYIRKFLTDNSDKFYPIQKRALEKGLLSLHSGAESALFDLILFTEQKEKNPEQTKIDNGEHLAAAPKIVNPYKSEIG